MTQPWIEPRSPGPLANTLTARPNVVKLRTCKNSLRNSYMLLSEMIYFNMKREHIIIFYVNKFDTF